MSANQMTKVTNVLNKHQTCFLLLLGLMAVVFLLTPEHAYAGTGGMEFDDVWVTLKDWTQGTLGRIVAGAMILVGLVGGVARQSLMAFALGIGGGVGLYNSPTVVESIMSATLTHMMEVIPAIVQISNGLGG
jgi:conjugal transfer pilus assembly protein TraA